MVTSAQQKFFASLSQFARSTADLLDEMSKGEQAAETKTPEPVKAKPPKAAPLVATPVEHKPAHVEAPKPAAATPATNGSGDIQTQCRKAAKAYAEVYGREGLKEILKKYTEGTLADVAPDKLDNLLKDLS